MFETVVAGITFVVCVALLVRLAVGRKRRQRLDDAARRTWTAWRGAARRALRWRSSRRAAAAAANDAIQRARGGVRREGNVIRPASFRRPRKPH